jgi:hypothetical protein
MTACRSWIKYAWSEHYCEQPSWPADPEGLCLLHSKMLGKDQEAFDQAVNAKLVREDFDFREVFFPFPFSLAKRKFGKTVNLRGARFAGWADFSDAEFAQGADFSQVRFSQEALFTQCRFAGQVHFQGTEFLGEGDFRGALLDGPVIFWRLNEPVGTAPRPPFVASCQYLVFGPAGSLRFQELSLAQVSFLGTDLRRVSFHNVTWLSQRGRQMVYDELLLSREEAPVATLLNPWPGPKLSYEDACSRVEELYRHLKLNYESEGDHKQAGDFHYGEMEMHRRSHPFRRRFPFSWYNLYWALSGYGERPLRALVWLAVLLASVSTLLTSSGLRTPDGSLAGWGEACIFLLQQATLLRPQWAAPVSPGGQLLIALSRVFLPAQTALVILALRNRLGRRR